MNMEKKMKIWKFDQSKAPKMSDVEKERQENLLKQHTGAMLAGQLDDAMIRYKNEKKSKSSKKGLEGALERFKLYKKTGK